MPPWRWKEEKEADLSVTFTMWGRDWIVRGLKSAARIAGEPFPHFPAEVPSGSVECALLTPTTELGGTHALSPASSSVKLSKTLWGPPGYGSLSVSPIYCFQEKGFSLLNLP